MDCKICGATSSFADDSNFTMSEKSDDILLETINRILENWVGFCNSNLLSINKRKMALMRLTTRQRHQINDTERVILNELDEFGKNIAPRPEHRILGINIKRDLTWGNNLKFGEKV